MPAGCPTGLGVGVTGVTGSLYSFLFAISMPRNRPFLLQLSLPTKAHFPSTTLPCTAFAGNVAVAQEMRYLTSMLYLLYK